MSRLLSCLAALVCLLCLVPSAAALTPNTTISDTIVGPNGSNPSGTAIISWSRYLNDASPTRQVIYPGSLTLRITNGVVNVSLYPISAVGLPTGGCFSVLYSLGGGPSSTRYWFVPVSTTPVTLNQIESSIGCTPGVAPIVSPSQINPGPAGQSTVLNSSGTGFVSWQLGGGGGGGGSAISISIPAGTSGTVTFNHNLATLNHVYGWCLDNVTGFVVDGIYPTWPLGLNTDILNIPNPLANTTTCYATAGGGGGGGGGIPYPPAGVPNSAGTSWSTSFTVSGNSGRLAQGNGTFTIADLGGFDSSGNIVDSTVAITNLIVATGSYANPSWITSLAGSKLSGPISCAGLPAFTGDIANTLCAITVNSTGGVAFAPSATTNALNASNISSGTLAAARLPAINLAASGPGGVTGNLQAVNVSGGTGCSTATWVRGDLSCQTIPAGGTVTNSFGPLSPGAIVIGNGGNDETVLTSLGTSAMALLGNATGSPNWGQINLATMVTGILPGLNGGSGNGFFSIAGPTGSLKTFTLPNASSAILTSNAAVTPAQGGLGGNFSAIALGGMVTGSGAGTFVITPLGTNGYVWTANSGAAGGGAWTSPTTGGTVTNIACTAPILCTPGPITATGVISGATLVTSAAALTNNAIMLGGGSQAAMALGSLGTTTQFLQGNSGGPPTWAAVNVGTSVTGALAIVNGGVNATSASAGTIPNATSGTASSWTATPTFGASGTLGTLTLGNATSGTITLAPVTGALGTVTATLPANAGVIAELNLAQTFSAAQTISSTLNVTGTFQSAGNSMTFPGAAASLTQTVCSGTISISGTINSASNSSFTTACTGLLTTDNISLDFNGSPLAITGFIPSASGMLTVLKWPSPNTINVSAVNNTSGPITLSSTVVLNFHVYR